MKDQEENIGKEEMLKNIFLMNSYPSVWNKLIRRELYIKNKIFHPTLRTDIEQFLQQHPSHFLRGKLEQSIFTLYSKS